MSGYVRPIETASIIPSRNAMLELKKESPGRPKYPIKKNRKEKTNDKKMA